MTRNTLFLTVRFLRFYVGNINYIVIIILYMNKTVIFEERYDTDINNFSTTKEVDEFLEKKLRRKPRVLPTRSEIIDIRI